LKREDITGFWKSHYVPDATWFTISGDVTAEEGFAMAEKAFGGWKGDEASHTLNKAETVCLGGPYGLILTSTISEPFGKKFAWCGPAFETKKVSV